MAGVLVDHLMPFVPDIMATGPSTKPDPTQTVINHRADSTGGNFDPEECLSTAWDTNSSVVDDDLFFAHEQDRVDGIDAYAGWQEHDEEDQRDFEGLNEAK